MYIKVVLVNYRSYFQLLVTSTPGPDTHLTDWFVTCGNGPVSTSDPHLQLYLFMFFCPLADFFMLTRVSCSCTDTSVPIQLYLSSFLCWVHLGFCLSAFSEVGSQTRPVDSFLAASKHFFEENRILMDQCKHFTWNFKKLPHKRDL